VLPREGHAGLGPCENARHAGFEFEMLPKEQGVLRLEDEDGLSLTKAVYGGDKGGELAQTATCLRWDAVHGRSWCRVEPGHSRERSCTWMKGRWPEG
jgi:hypothetical protein